MTIRVTSIKRSIIIVRSMSYTNMYFESNVFEGKKISKIRHFKLRISFNKLIVGLVLFFDSSNNYTLKLDFYL